MYSNDWVEVAPQGSCQRPSVGESSLAGEVKVVFSKNALGLCTVRDLYQSGSLRVSPLRHEIAKGSLNLIHLGGGAVAGDRLYASIEVLDGASVHLQDQGSLKIFKSAGLCGSSIRVDVEVRDGSHFSYVGEPVVLYGHARFSSEVVIDIESGSASYLEVCGPGVGFHELQRPRYDYFSSTVSLTVDRTLTLYDKLTTDRSDPQLFDDTCDLLSVYPYLGTYVAADTKGPGSTFLDDISKVLSRISQKDRGFSLRFATHNRHISARILSKQRDTIYSLLAPLTKIK